MKRAVLKKDIVIKAGTVFSPSSTRTIRFGEGHFSAGLGLSTDTAGEITYFVGGSNDSERKQLSEWFDVED